MKPRLWVGALGILGLVALLYLGAMNVSPAKRIRRINAPEPKLQAAIAEARDKLSVFVYLLDQSPPLTRFATKVKFDTDAGPEYLWVKNPSHKAEAWTGILDQPPIAVRGKQKGDEVKFDQAAIVDWMIIPPKGSPEGGFTERALKP